MAENKREMSKFNLQTLGGETPWLVHAHGARTSKRKQCQTFTSMSPLPPNNKSYVKSFPVMRGKSIKGSCTGWLILLHRCETNCIIFTLFNPVTLQSIQLPEFQDELHIEDEMVQYLLISTPDLDDCVFVVFDCEQVFFCRPSRGDYSTWVKQTLEVDGKSLDVFKTAVLDRIIYCLATVGEQLSSVMWTIASIKVDDASNSVIVKRLQSGWPDCHMSYFTRHLNLVESCGAVYCVGRYIRDGDSRYSIIKVWRLDLEEQNWVEVNSLNGRAFFIGEDSCCTWCWGSSDGVPGNSVYYIWDHFRDHEVVYCYKLHENSTMLLHVCPALINPCTSLVWHNPQHHRLLQNQRRKEVMKKEDLLNQAETSAVGSDEGSEMQESLLCELPLELVELITKKLQLFEYLNFRATCKLFQSLEGRGQNSIPYFIFFKEEFRTIQVIDPFQPSYSSSIILRPSQEPFFINFIKNGWLLVTVDYPKHSLQFFNPFTRELGLYPPNVELESVGSIGFSTYPTSPDCLTVGFYGLEERIYIYYHQYGDENWNRCTFLNQGLLFSHVTSAPVYYKGGFYILTTGGYLGRFILKDGKGSWETYDEPQTNQSNKYLMGTSSHLLECNGQLYSVFFGYYGKWVNVFRFNSSKKTWVPVHNIGNYCFFLSHSSSISADTYWETGIRNRIYLPRFKGKNEMLFYCLETCKYGTSASEDTTLEDFCNSTEPLNFCWI
ncbi:hypothetical protein RDABS01_038430 [Bienertia sinuspersici]